MILDLSSLRQRGILIVAALLLATFLSYFSIRNALAVHSAGLQTLAGFERATRLEPDDFRNWSLLGRYWQYNLEDTDTARAIQAYDVALLLNPHSAEIWSDLASAYEAEGNLPAARDAFLRAKRAYPLSAEVSWSYGNFLLRQGEMDAALAEIRHAVEADPHRGAEALSRALRVEPDINLVLDRVLPPISEAYTSAIADQMADDHSANALEVWSRLALLHPRVPLQTSFLLVSALTREKRFADAQRVWEQAVDFAGLANLPATAGSAVWDGGFESGLGGGGLAWTFPQGVRDVQIGFDAREKHSGNRSLRLMFDAKSNLHLIGPCHEVLVQPSTIYLFSAWARTLSLTTDQGVRFQLRPLSTQDNPTTLTNDLHGNQPWTRLEIPWSSGKDVQEMEVCVIRLPSQEADDKIQGTAWVDDVALVPESAEPSKP